MGAGEEAGEGWKELLMEVNEIGGCIQVRGKGCNVDEEFWGC